MGARAERRPARPRAVRARVADGHGVDDYLGAIYELREEGRSVAQAEIARRLGVSRASVSEQVARLRAMGLIGESARPLEFTQHGVSVAEGAVRRHRMAERFLTDVLGIPWHLAHEEADRFQAGITDQIEERMLAMLGGPATCPHGNPIPGTGAVVDPKLEPLAAFAPGDEVVLKRLTEDIEVGPEELRVWEENGLMPGARVTVLEASRSGAITVGVGFKRTKVPPHLTDNLWVRATAETEKRRASD